jgi:hypothetical protein
VWLIPKLILFTEHNERRDIPVQCEVISKSVGNANKKWSRIAIKHQHKMAYQLKVSIDQT